MRIWILQPEQPWRRSALSECSLLLLSWLNHVQRVKDSRRANQALRSIPDDKKKPNALALYLEGYALERLN